MRGAEIPDRTVHIGVLTDMGGPNADSTREGSAVAAKLAADDAAKFMPGITVSVIGADHQNKADVASSIARDWIANQAINVITDIPASSAGLAVAEVARGQPRTVFVASGTGASDLTGKRCSPNTLHWTYDSYTNGSVVARALSEEGAKTWFSSPPTTHWAKPCSATRPASSRHSGARRQHYLGTSPRLVDSHVR